jgi:hypothetical protein
VRELTEERTECSLIGLVAAEQGIAARIGGDRRLGMSSMWPRWGPLARTEARGRRRRGRESSGTRRFGEWWPVAAAMVSDGDGGVRLSMEENEGGDGERGRSGQRVQGGVNGGVLILPYQLLVAVAVGERRSARRPRRS